MDQRQTNPVLATFFQILLASKAIMNVNEMLKRLKSHRHTKQARKNGHSSQHDDLTLIAAFVSQQRCTRRFWVDRRSSHWITPVLDGMLLQEAQFDKAFRMSRNSFEILHGILGTIIPISQQRITHLQPYIVKRDTRWRQPIPS